MSKKSDGNRAVIIDDQFVPMLRSLPKEQAGELFQAMLDYQCDEDVRIEDPSMMAIFSMLRESIDKHNEAYEKKRLAQIENGKKGGRPKKQSVSEESEKNPWVSVETQENPQKAVRVMDKDIEKKNSPTESKKKSRAAFTPPTPEEVREYEVQTGLSDEAHAFVDHYTSNGWLVGGKTKMKDWKSARRNWERNKEKFGNRDAPKQEYHNRYNDFPQRNNDYKQIEEEWIRRAFGA